MKYFLSLLFLFFSFCGIAAAQSNAPHEEFINAADATPTYRASKSHRMRNVFLNTEFLLIDHANAKVETADGIPVDFEGPGLSYVVRNNMSLRLTRHLAFNAATQNSNLFSSTNARVMINCPHGLIGAFGYRRVFNPMAGGDGSTPHMEMLGASITKRINRWITLNFAFDTVRTHTFNADGPTHKSRVNLHATFTF